MKTIESKKMSLSNKITHQPKDEWGNLGFDYVLAQDVSEAVKELKNKIVKDDRYTYRNSQQIFILLNEVFGEELT